MKLKIKLIYLRVKDWIHRNSKKIKSTFYILGISFFIFFITVTLASAVKLPLNLNVYTVLTGSMKPKITPGSVIFTKESKYYYENDIVTFNDHYQKLPVTHRIIEVNKDDDEISYKTKGDFNPSPDYMEIHDEDIIGKMFFHVPLIGFIIDFAKTVPGFVVIIIIPAVVIVYGEINTAKKQIKRIKKNKQNNNSKSMTDKLANELGEDSEQYKNKASVKPKYDNKDNNEKVIKKRNDKKTKPDQNKKKKRKNKKRKRKKRKKKN